MGYTLRYFVTDDKPLSPQILRTGLRQLAPAYSLEPSADGSGSFDLKHGDELCGFLEIRRAGDELFAEELDDARQFAREARGKDRDVVLAALDRARTLVAVEVPLEGRETEPALALLEPLWQWLEANYRGLLQED